jgi:hypothetical protein
MIREHSWLGVGPGNFGRHYTQYMTPSDYEEIQDPHNFALELWATCGVVGMLALLVALGAVAWQVRSGLRRSVAEVKASSSPERKQRAGPAWEFYLGGMAGLLLGFTLRAWFLTGDYIVVEAALSTGRSLVWFVAFALFESVRWAGPSRLLALTVGAAVLLLNLCVSGGIGMPAVAQPLWAVLALAVADATRLPEPHQQPAGFLWRVLPVPVFGGLVLFYLMIVLYPVAASARLSHRALEAGRQYLESVKQPKEAPSEERTTQRRPTAYLDQRVIKPLEEATKVNPGDARLLLRLAEWEGILWGLTHRPADQEKIRKHLLAAQELDSRGRDAYLTAARLEEQFADAFQLLALRKGLPNIFPAYVPWSSSPFINPQQPLASVLQMTFGPQRTREWFQAQYAFLQAAHAMLKVVENSPTEPHLRLSLAANLFAAGYKAEAGREAAEALRLDKLATHPARKLADAEKAQIRQWFPAPRSDSPLPSP